MNMTEGKLKGLKSVVDELKLDIKRLKREIRNLTKIKNSGCYDDTVKRRRREGRTWVAKKCIKCECRVRDKCDFKREKLIDLIKINTSIYLSMTYA